MTDFKTRFRQLRRERDLSQEELANDFNEKFHYNFGKSSISMYENGKRMPEVNALEDFATYFDVSIDFLLGRTDIRRTDDPNGEEDIVTIAAHHDGEEFTEEEKKMIEDFKDMVRKMKQKKGQ